LDSLHVDPDRFAC